MIVLFQAVADCAKLVVNLLVCLFKLSEFLRSADAGNYVFALSVHKVFAHELVDACRRIAAEGNAGS